MEYVKEPKPKRQVYVTRDQPFPVVIESVSGIPVSERLWQTYTGRYNGDSVVVEKDSDIHAIYTKGFFGKGSLSKYFPNFGRIKHGVPPFISERQWKQRRKWKDLETAELQATDVVAVKVEQSTVCTVKQEELSGMDCSSNLENTDDRLLREQGPQAFPPDLQSGQKDSGSTETVSTSYRPPTIKFHRDPRNRRSSSVHILPENSESAGALPIVAEDKQFTAKGKSELQKQRTEDPAESEIVEQHCNHPTVDEQVGAESAFKEGERRSTRNSDTGGVKKETTVANSPVSHNSDNLTFENINEDTRIPYMRDQGISDEVIVLCDSDSEDEELQIDKLRAKLVQNPYPLREQLHLTLEEAFFLCYALGCLQILDLLGNIMSLRDVWETFRSSDAEFVQKYVAYHHFRAKGWVVRPGIKYGSDFLLYKEGPPFYHASYIVMVEVLREANWCRSPEHNRRSISWPFLFGANRLAETVGKEILMCRVMWPSSVPAHGPNTPRQLARFCVQEVLLKRWVSSQEREELDQEEITQ